MNIPKTELPRERFKLVGVKSLLTEELLAIILKTGSKTMNVLELSKSIISNLESINNLKNISLNKLMEYEGIGMVKAMELLSAIELGRRIYENVEYKEIIKLNKAEKVFDYISKDIGDLKQEYFFVLYLDNKKNLINKKLLFKGTVNASLVHPREIYNEAYRECATSIICVHNHPSGNVLPSPMDIETTRKIVDTGNILGIPMTDHVIVSGENFFSFYESGYI